MPNNLFHYRGRDASGNSISGKLESESIDNVITYLINRNITPIDIIKISGSSFSLKKILTLNIGSTKIKAIHIINLCRQLATLNNVGLPITKALDRLAKSTNISVLKVVLETIAHDVAAGMTLSSALKKHPNIFSEITVNMIEVGENTGKLSESLIHLSEQLESSLNNQRRLLSTIRYPLVVIVTAIVAMIIMNFLVIPKFSSMFSKFDLELPFATKAIIASSNFMVDNKNLILGIFIGIVIFLKWLLKFPKIRKLYDEHKLNIPIIGNIQRSVLVSQFAWSFSLILKSGIPIIKSVDLATGAVNNSYFRDKLKEIAKAIDHGESFSNAATHSKLFAPIVLQMIEIGEEGQNLDDTLHQIAHHYDMEVDYELGRINKLIEPLLLVILGGVVLMLALGIYFPMWDLIKIAQF